jgi:hypothetical protein
MRRIQIQRDTFALRLADSSGAGDYVNNMTQDITPSGVTDATSLAQGANGQPYTYGGGHNNAPGLDCTGLQGQLYSTLTGKPGTQFTTDSFDPKGLGFQPGYNPDSHYNVGVDTRPGENGHMVGELGGTKVESSGAGGVQFGGTARGPLDLANDPKHGPNTQLYHLPDSMIANSPKTPTSTPEVPSLLQPIKPLAPLGTGGH